MFPIPRYLLFHSSMIGGNCPFQQKKVGKKLEQVVRVGIERAAINSIPFIHSFIVDLVWTLSFY